MGECVETCRCGIEWRSSDHVATPREEGTSPSFLKGSRKTREKVGATSREAAAG